MNISIVDDAENEENHRLLETVGLVPFVLFTVYDYIMLFLGEIWRNYNFTGTKQTTYSACIRSWRFSCPNTKTANFLLDWVATSRDISKYDHDINLWFKR